MSDIVRITVLPRVKRYLRIQFGEYIRISDHNTISMVLRGLFQPFDKRDPALVRPDNKKHHLGAFFDVAMGNNGLRYYGGYMTGKNIKAFSAAVDLQIKEEMVRWVWHVRDDEPKVDYAIRGFLEWYGWPEDEFTFDNAKRWYYRDREEQMKRAKEIEKITPQLVIPLLIEDEPSEKKILINPIAERQLSILLG